MKIYIAIVQCPLASLDDTAVEAFATRNEAERWANEKLDDDIARNGYSKDEMNWDVREMEIAI